MSLLLTLAFRSVCRTTHQRLAVDALRHLRLAEAERWSDLLLHHHAEYLAGCDAPDSRFKDFRNHVVLVAAQYWGGAPQEARRWYGRVVDALRRRQWDEAAFAAGALCHYVSDPLLPLNTAHSEVDTKIRQALQWSIEKCYGRLQHIIEHDLSGYPQIETPRGDDWLERMVVIGAELAHEHYATVLQHFDLALAVRDPLAGMDEECQDRIAVCLGHAVVGFARIIERAVSQAGVEPPAVETALQGFLVAAGAPVRRLVRHFHDLSMRMALEALLDEAQRTGKVVKNLGEEAREIRRLHAEEVLRMPLAQLDQQPVGLTGTLYGSGRAERFHSNRLITTPVLPSDAAISSAWRDAQRRVRESGVPRVTGRTAA
jgi:hypothetical protein